jgi:aldehyde:ferredoxin oxidoreductase
VKRAVEKVGMHTLKWAMINSKGLEHSGVDTRFTKGYALSFAVNPRGPDHLHTQVLAEYGASPEALALIKKITGDEKWASPFYTEYRAEIVRYYEDCYAVTDALGFCTFTGSVIHENPKVMAEVFSAATGIPISGEEIMLIGRRILTLEKCFNVREGADRKLDDLPWRMMNEPAPPGRLEGAVTSREELDKMLNKYYELHGWDPNTSWPYRETLVALGLDDVAEELDKIGKLPKNSSKRKG